MIFRKQNKTKNKKKLLEFTYTYVCASALKLSTVLQVN